jgi:hypothetical protein
MNDNTESEYEYRVMYRFRRGYWVNYFGTRAYPNIATARGLKSSAERRGDGYEFRIERRPVVQEWEVIE